MKRPDGCTCEGRDAPDHGSHLPGCTVVPMVLPTSSEPLMVMLSALDDWYEFRGANPNAALRSAVTVFLDDCRRRTGRWETPAQTLARWTTTSEAIERAFAAYPDWCISRSTVLPTRYFANRERVGHDDFGEGDTLAAAIAAALQDEATSPRDFGSQYR